MSVMEELNFFLGLQVRQSSAGIFISQEKYIKTLLKKYSMENSSSAKTPMSLPINSIPIQTENPLIRNSIEEWSDPYST